MISSTARTRPSWQLALKVCADDRLETEDVGAKCSEPESDGDGIDVQHGRGHRPHREGVA